MRAEQGLTMFVSFYLVFLVFEQKKQRYHQELFLFHSCRSLAEVPFLRHFLRKQELHHNFHYVVLITGTSQQLPQAPFFHAGRLSKQFLQTILPLDDYEM
jgi:hypothetical protein